QQPVDHDDRQRRQRQSRIAKSAERFAERPRPQRTPHDLRAKAHGREVREFEMTGVCEVPGCDREVPVVADWKVAARIDEDDRDRPHGQDAHDLDDVAASHHCLFTMKTSPRCNPNQPSNGKRATTTCPGIGPNVITYVRGGRNIVRLRASSRFIFETSYKFVGSLPASMSVTGAPRVRSEL